MLPRLKEYSVSGVLNVNAIKEQEALMDLLREYFCSLYNCASDEWIEELVFETFHDDQKYITVLNSIFTNTQHYA